MAAFEKIESESVDCVVTDCPYHIVSGGCTKDPVKIGRSRKREKHGGFLVGDTNHVNLGGIFDEFNELKYTKQGKLFQFNEIKFTEWLPEVYRVLKPGTHCYIMINHRNLKDLQQAAENVGFVFQNLIVWDKGNSLPNKFYMNSYELILMLRKGPARKINNMGTSNILRVPNIIHDKEHPTEKPAELMQILIENSTLPGQTVLDPFMGVGGTGVACIKTGRNFIGIEIDEKYFNIAEQKIEGPEEMSFIPAPLVLSNGEQIILSDMEGEA
jgi:site-specific DNA-methyltransferase (adenine-specific)